MVMMDDTVILSTTLDGMKRKTEILHDFCNSHGMTVNDNKINFMVMKGTNVDKEPLICNNNSYYCNHYINLGTPFTENDHPQKLLGCMLIMRRAIL